MFIVSNAAAVHRSRLGCSSILQPNCGPRTAGRIKNGEIFKIVRNKSRDLDQFMIERGRVRLHIAYGCLDRFLAPAESNRRKKEKQSAEGVSSHAHTRSLTPPSPVHNLNSYQSTVPSHSGIVLSCRPHHRPHPAAVFKMKSSNCKQDVPKCAHFPLWCLAASATALCP